MADFEIKQTDRHPELTATLVDENGDAISVSGATITFSMKAAKTGTLKVNNQACTGANPTTYSWQANDTDTPGLYLGEFKVTYADGRTARCPNNGHIEIVVYSKVN